MAKDATGYVAKLADFGMSITDEMQTLVSTAEPTNIQASVKGKTSFGTWEYMAPECWKRKYGKPGLASDIFSFGLMLWEMVARSRVYKAFHGVADIPNADGSAKVELVAARLAGAQDHPPKPQRPEASTGCPSLLYKVMQACWVPEMTERRTAPDLLRVIQLIRDRDGALDPAPEPELEPEPEPEPELEPEPGPYDDFLAQVGLVDKKEILSGCGLDEGLELQQLREYDDDELEEDILDDDDLALDEAGKARFRNGVEALRAAAVKAVDTTAVATTAAAAKAEAETEAGAEAAAEMHSAWAALNRELGGEDSLEDALAAARSQVEELRAQVEELRAQEAPAEGTPPQ